MKSSALRRVCLTLSIALFAMSSPMSSHASEDPALLKDLTAVLALLGMPCGQVISAVRAKENDHLAACQDGNRYRVFMNPEGRVVAQKQPAASGR